MLACPRPYDGDRITLAHGGGGTRMHRLIQDVFLARLGGPVVRKQCDAAMLSIPQEHIAFTTDGFVVQPLFFPGGDIGVLAVYGTVNDLAMAGARPLYLSAGFILEEGLPLETLERVVNSMAAAAKKAGVRVVTGDTKVVERGAVDGLFITTAGIGVRDSAPHPAPDRIRPGDHLVLNGDLGRHGMAIMAQREGLEFESSIESDVAPLHAPVQALLDAVDVRCLRDLTRGGLASACNELAAQCGHAIHLRERDIPVNDMVAGACELLGLDPMHVANEGRFIAVVPAEQSAHAVEILRAAEPHNSARCIGEVRNAGGPPVTVESLIGVDRILDMLSGEQLPRIC